MTRRPSARAGRETVTHPVIKLSAPPAANDQADNAAHDHAFHQLKLAALSAAVELIGTSPAGTPHHGLGLKLAAIVERYAR